MLTGIVDTEFVRLAYTEAVEILENSAQKFEFPVQWGIDLQSEEFLNHIETGMQVIKIELEWKENCQFVIKEDLSINRLKFSDILQESLKDLDKDDIAGRFDADFAIMGAEVAELIPLIFEAFGGIDDDITSADS